MGLRTERSCRWSLCPLCTESCWLLLFFYTWRIRERHSVSQKNVIRSLVCWGPVATYCVFSSHVYVMMDDTVPWQWPPWGSPDLLGSMWPLSAISSPRLSSSVFCSLCLWWIGYLGSVGSGERGFGSEILCAGSPGVWSQPFHVLLCVSEALLFPCVGPLGKLLCFPFLLPVSEMQMELTSQTVVLIVLIVTQSPGAHCTMLMIVIIIIIIIVVFF